MRIRLQLGVVLGLMALGTVSLSGCGVRGSLDTPPSADGTPKEGAKTGTLAPHKPSILDPLIR